MLASDGVDVVVGASGVYHGILLQLLLLVLECVQLLELHGMA